MSERRYSAVEPLTTAHSLDDFDCGSAGEANWLRDHGLTAQISGARRVYVVRRISDNRVVGFHVLAAGAALPLEVPGRVANGFGSYPISVIILSRLGVDLSEQRHGLGRALLVDALERVNAAADIVGVRALLIHAADERSRRFALALAEFEASPTDPLHLFLPVKDLRQSLK